MPTSLTAGQLIGHDQISLQYLCDLNTGIACGGCIGAAGSPDYFQQPAKAITEDVSVMRGPDALEWIRAVQEEIESFKRLGVCEEAPKGKATSTPLPARLILVTKPNVHGGPARKKARIVICGNFQEVHLDEFTASKTPSHPSLRMALSVASHWDGRSNAGTSPRPFCMPVSLETETRI